MGTDNKNGKGRNKLKHKFNYEAVLTYEEGETLTKQIEKSAVYCETCEKPLSIKFNEGYISFLCGCGMRLFFPCRDNKIYHSKFVTSEIHREMQKYAK